MNQALSQPLGGSENGYRVHAKDQGSSATVNGGLKKERIETLLQRRLVRAQPLPGGMISQVLRLDLADATSIVAKVGEGGHDLTVEAYMLRYLRDKSRLPVPQVLHAEPNLLLMEHIAGEAEWSGASLPHLAQLLADCHQARGEAYGLERDTLIGPLRQPNSQSMSWISFFREQRLLYMVEVARESGHLPPALEERLLRIAGALDEFLIEPSYPCLIHGDMWRTNVIARGGRVVGIIDPALYYAHNEIELAYMTLFDGVGEAFFQTYRERIPLAAEFFETRRHIYNLYPLLVHLTIFGEKYLPPLRESLARFGY